MDLNKLISKADEAKKELKLAKQKEKEATTELKDYMESWDLETMETDKYKVTNKEVVSTSINEEVLVDVIINLIANAEGDLKDLLRECLVVKTVVDEDKVQELIYKGFLDVEAISPAVVEKKHTRLTIKEVK